MARRNALSKVGEVWQERNKGIEQYAYNKEQEEEVTNVKEGLDTMVENGRYAYVTK